MSTRPNRKRGTGRSTDWSRYGRTCHVCAAKPYTPCLDTRKFTDVPKTRPHDGRGVTQRVYRGKLV